MTDSVHVQDMEQHESQLDSSNKALCRLKKYISNYPDGIILAGPPTLKGCLANFYKEHPADGATIKAFEYEQHKIGIHSFAQKYRDVITFNGKGAQKHVVLATRLKPFRRYSDHQVVESEHLIESRLGHQVRTNYQIIKLRGTIRSIEVLLKELSDQVDKLSS